jgi:hypothetical protein
MEQIEELTFFTKNASWIIPAFLTVGASLIGIIAYFLRRLIKQYDDQVKDSDARENGYKKAIDVVTSSVLKLDKATVKLEGTINAQQEICQLQHSGLNEFVKDTKKKMEDTEKRLHKTEVRLTKLNGQS